MFLRISTYVVVVVVILSWLSGVLCYRGYKSARAQQAPLWGGSLKAGLQGSREEGGTRELYHSHFLAKLFFFSKLQTAALIEFLDNLNFAACP